MSRYNLPRITLIRGKLFQDRYFLPFVVFCRVGYVWVASMAVQMYEFCIKYVCHKLCFLLFFFIKYMLSLRHAQNSFSEGGLSFKVTSPKEGRSSGPHFQN